MFWNCEHPPGCYGCVMRYTLDELDAFLTVIELGTVTAAASRLNLSKSVISKRISDLECTIGTALFRRNAGRIAPTEAALRLTERLRPALTELRAATETAALEGSAETSLRGRLSIAAPMSFGVMYLGPILASFAAAHPELELRIDYDDRARDLVQDGIDVSIRIGAIRDSALIARKLCEDRSVPCASPDYIARHGAPRDHDDLRHHHVIGYSNLANARMWEFGLETRALPVPMASRISLNNGEAIRDFVVAGLGLGILPGFLVARELASGALVRVLPDIASKAVPICAVWPPVAPMPAKLRAFVDHMVHAFADGPPWHHRLADRTGAGSA